MQLLLMRHGQTSYNLLGLCNDDPRVDVQLSETGIAQANAAAETLRLEKIEQILVSALPRTRQTAELINRYHQVPVQTQRLLNDIRSGFEGRPVADYFAAVGHDRYNLRPPGGESLHDYQARVLPVLDWLRAQPWNCVLVVAHEETLRVLVGALRGLSQEQLLAQHFENCQCLRFNL